MNIERKEYTLTCPIIQTEIIREKLRAIVENKFVNVITGITITSFLLNLTVEQAKKCKESGILIQLEIYDLRTCEK